MGLVDEYGEAMNEPWQNESDAKLAALEMALELANEPLSAEDGLRLIQLRSYLVRQAVLMEDSVLIPEWIQAFDKLTGGRFK